MFPQADWGEILSTLAHSMHISWDDALEMPLYLIYIYYEWSLYRESMDIYIRAMTMGV